MVDADRPRPSVTVTAVVAGVIVAQQVAGKATRDAFFLQQFGPRELASVMTLSATLALLTAWSMSRLFVRWSPARVAPWLLGASGVLFLAEWLLAQTQAPLAATVTYVHTGALGGVTVSAFWSLVNERLDPHTAKKSMGRLWTGAGAGGVCGGLLAWLVASVAGVSTTLAVLGGLNLACAALLRPPRWGSGRVVTPDAALSFSKAFRGTPYLWRLTGLLALVELSDTLVDYVFKAGASAHFSDGAELAAFFSAFHAGVAVLTFGLQLGLTQRVLEGVGLSHTAAVLPGGTVGAAVLAIALPGIGTAALLRALTVAADLSLFRPAYELGYTPLPSEKKRPTKALIDVGSGKLASALGGAVTMVLVAVTSPSAARVPALVIVVLAGSAGLLMARALARGYRKALADALRSGALVLGPHELLDASTRSTYAESMAIDREELLARIAAWRGEVDEGDVEPAAEIDPRDVAIAALASRDPRRVRGVLSEHARLSRELLPHAIPLLAVDAVLSEVLIALREVVDDHVEVFCAALLAPETPFAVRRRLPRVLGASKRQQAVEALTAGLSDARFEVRYRCGVALMRTLSKTPALEVDRDAVLAAVRRETAVDRAMWERQQLVDVTEAEDASPLEAPIGGGTPRYAVVHAFTLLALVLEPEPLLLAYAALASDDEKVRGTGLEYVDLVVPADIREQLQPLLSDTPRDVRTRSSRAELIERLQSSKDSLSIDGAALRALLGERD